MLLHKKWKKKELFCFQLYRENVFIKLCILISWEISFQDHLLIFFKHWFTELPPVLTFELSRFEFNQALGRPEKIHNKLEFPSMLYMDR